MPTDKERITRLEEHEKVWEEMKEKVDDMWEVVTGIKWFFSKRFIGAVFLFLVFVIKLPVQDVFIYIRSFL